MSDSVDNSPGRNALKVMETVQKELVFKAPNGVPRKRRKIAVLDEETYVEEIGNIIQRDFFPELEKIKAQNDYLDAVAKNDAVRLRKLYMKYSGSRPPSERMPSPATFETPSNLHPTQEDLNLLNNNNNKNKDGETNSEKTLSLDQYLNSHTSQDNESFEEILDKNEEKLMEKYQYLYGIEQESGQDQEKLLTLPSVEQQAALPVKPFNINTWGYKNKNYLMYNPDGVQLTEEQELKILENRQEINYKNTRLKLNPFNEIRSKETINEMAKTQAKVLDGKIGVDGKELLKPETPKIGGFSLIRTPTPSASILGSPLMTWGEIEGTPFRLDGSDTPLPRSHGTAFKMSEPPRREQLAFALAEKVGEKNRDQKKKDMDAQRRQFSSPSPRPNTSTVDRLASMSPAARKLASTHLRISSSSFALTTPSPHRTPQLGVKTTPKRPATTPKRVATTPKLDLGIKKSVEVSTDDLLKIQLPHRKSAADFF